MSNVPVGPHRDEHFGDTTRPTPSGNAAASTPAAKALRLQIIAVLILLVAIVTIIGIPRLPPGVCYGDAGDLQLASACLGITHPPGYTAYVTLGRLATLLPGVEPAYAVSLLCMSLGILVLILCVLIQVELGVNPWAAGAVALLLTAHPRFWLNLTTPEVYMPSLAFLVGAVYLVIRYARTHRQIFVYAAAFLFGVAIANRPPLLLLLPFFVIAWWLAARRREHSAYRWLKSSLVILGLGALPSFYSFAYLWVRDTPQTPYNYLEQHNAENHEYRQSTAGSAAKLERVIWHASAKQFHYRVGNDWRGIRAKLRWLRVQLVAYDALPYTVIGLLGVLGAVVTLRRNVIAGILLCGLCLQTAFFVCMFRDVGQAADLMPLLFSSVVFGGVTLSLLFPQGGNPRRNVAACALMIAISVLTILHVPHRPRYGASIDAEPYLKEADLLTFPKNSVIIAVWTESLPLLYEQYLIGTRPDIKVVIAQPGNWLRMAKEYADRPIFFARKDGLLKERGITPFRNMWWLAD